MILSEHFKRSLKLIGGAVIVLLMVFAYLFHRLKGLERSSSQAPAVLPRNVKERIVYNDKAHTITTETKTGTTTTYSTNPVITISDSNHVTIANHLLGTEFSPFAGFGWSNCPRVFVGIDALHFARIELHGELGISQDGHPGFIEPYLGIGYNVWSNTSLNLAVNPFTIYTVPQVAGFISLKF